MFSYFVNVIQKFEKSSLENFHTNAHKTFKILNRLYVNLDCLSQWRVYHKETFKILLKTIIDIDKNVFWTWQSIIQILYFAGNSLALVSFKQEVQGLTLIFKSSRSVGLLQHFFYQPKPYFQSTAVPYYLKYIFNSKTKDCTFFSLSYFFLTFLAQVCLSYFFFIFCFVYSLCFSYLSVLFKGVKCSKITDPKMKKKTHIIPVNFEKHE